MQKLGAICREHKGSELLTSKHQGRTTNQDDDRRSELTKSTTELLSSSRHRRSQTHLAQEGRQRERPLMETTTCRDVSTGQRRRKISQQYSRRVGRPMPHGDNGPQRQSETATEDDQRGGASQQDENEGTRLSKTATGGDNPLRQQGKPAQQGNCRERWRKKTQEDHEKSSSQQDHEGGPTSAGQERRITSQRDSTRGRRPTKTATAEGSAPKDRRRRPPTKSTPSQVIQWRQGRGRI